MTPARLAKMDSADLAGLGGGRRLCGLGGRMVKRARHGPLDDYMLGGGAAPAPAGPGARLQGFSGFH